MIFDLEAARLNISLLAFVGNRSCCWKTTGADERMFGAGDMPLHDMKGASFSVLWLCFLVPAKRGTQEEEV